MIGNRFYTWFKNYYQWVGGAFSETLLLPLVRATAGLRAGAIRYDETTNTVETYDGANWNAIPSATGFVPNSRTITINGTTFDLSTNRIYSVGTVTSVGLSMPAAFTVSGSPVTGSGTLSVAGAGLATQYVRGDGTLANFPTTQGGGSSVSYYLNGSVNQGTFGGDTYYEMNRTPILGAGTDFSRNTNGYIASFITDANDPGFAEIPGGNFNLEFYFSASSGGGNPSFYVELYKYDGTNFTLIASNQNSPDSIVGATKDSYFTALAVPQTTLALTDRLAIRVYVTTSGRTITFHTENNNLAQIITTFSTGINTINGLTKQVQFLTTGTGGTDFNINSTNSTHTFNIPTASATNRGALSSTDWTTFNNKVSATRTLTINGTAFDLSANRSWNVGTVTSVGLNTGSAGNDINVSGSPVSVSGNITLNIPTASATNRGALSAADWAIFNAKQNALTLTTTGNSGAATLVNSTLNIPQYTASGLGAVPTSRTLTINGTAFDLSANRSWSVGTVTSVGLNSTTSGVNITNTPVTGSGALTINIATASGSQNGLLSSTDWTTFNNKQNALTNPVTGTGANGQVSFWTGTGTQSGSNNLFWNNTNGRLGIGTSSPSNARTVITTDGVDGASEVALALMSGDPSLVTNQEVRLNFGQGANANVALAQIGAAYTGTSFNGNLIFRTNFGASGNLNERMRITSGGNALIGTTTDDGARLQVNGITSLTGTTATDGGQLGSELLTSANWTTTGWTGDFTTGFTNGAGNTTALSNSFAAVINTAYQIAYTITGRTAGSVTIALGGQSNAGVTATGAFGPQATTTGNLVITPTSDFNGTIVLSLRAISNGSATVVLRNSAGTITNEIRNYTANSNIALGVNAGRRITTGVSNIFIGLSAGQANTTGAGNTFVGTFTGINNTTGRDNSFFGRDAGQNNTTGGNNTFVGSTAGFSNTTGIENTFVGSNSGFANTTGLQNTFIGLSAGAATTTGNNNTFIGRAAGFANTTGEANTIVGRNAGLNNISGNNNSFFGASAGLANTTGASNSFFGVSAGGANTTGNSNVFFGLNAGALNTTGPSNTSVGTSAGQNNTTGGSNVFLGFDAGRRIAGGGNLTVANNSVFIGRDTRANASSETNQIVIGDAAIGLGSNTTVIGNSSTTHGRWFGRLLLGTSTDNATDALQVSGSGLFNSSVKINASGVNTSINAISSGLQLVADGSTEANRNIVFTTATTERMRLNNSGNLGLSVTPSAWGSGRTVLQLGNDNSYVVGSRNTVIANNAYNDGSNWRYLTSSVNAHIYAQLEGGSHAWYTAPSGTAGNAISFTQAMTLDASGRLGIGTTSPSTTLVVSQQSDNTNVAIFHAGGGTTNRGLRIATFAAVNDNAGVTLDAQASTGILAFATAGTERMRITSGGVLNIGQSSFNVGSISARDSFYSFDSKHQYIFMGMVGNNAVINADWFSGAGGAVPNLIFQTGANNRMQITSGGNVGIATDSPANRLVVVGGTDLSTAVFSHTGNDGGIDVINSGTLASGRSSQLRLSNGTTFFGANDRTYQIVNAGASSTAADLYFQYWNGSTYAERMRILSGGAVCIGRTTAFGAGFALNVEDNIYASAALVVGTTIQTGAPTGGTSRQWKLGDVATVTPTSPNRTIEVEINGTTYYIHAKTTNN